MNTDNNLVIREIFSNNEHFIFCTIYGQIIYFFIGLFLIQFRQY